jgi:hypothetical protein
LKKIEIELKKIEKAGRVLPASQKQEGTHLEPFFSENKPKTKIPTTNIHNHYPTLFFLTGKNFLIRIPI